MEPERLARLPLFSELDDEQLAKVASCTHEQTVEAGTALTTQGDHAYELFVIESGEAEVSKGGEHIHSLRPGDVFGEIGLLATGTRTASIVATTPMTLAVIFSREFRQIERSMPTIAASLREMMRERVARTSF
jgi:CRP-like cAMP-binding protein